jgi:hypothetical protein
MNTEELYIGIGVIGYVVYLILLNWMYIREYTIKGYKNKGVIKRGNEWDE